jgi:hypothetical protein
MIHNRSEDDAYAASADLSITSNTSYLTLINQFGLEEDELI